MKTGYVIAKNKTAKDFFTSTSSYDRPQWISVSEATIYPSAEIAQSAVTKLWKNGSYSACLKPLSEALPMNPNKPDELAGQGIGDEQYYNEDDLKDKMKVGTLSRDDDENPDEYSLDDDEIETLDDDDELNDEINDGDKFNDEEDFHNEDEFGSDLDPEHSSRFQPRDQEENEQAFLSPLEQAMSKGRRPTPLNIRKAPRLGESLKESDYPTTHKNQSEASPSENKTIATDLKKPEVIKYKQQLTDPADAKFDNDVDSLYNPNSTPANIISALKNGINEFQTAADYNNGKDDAQASHALTIASALQDILTDLQQGTKEGLKQAQIRITTYWNGITTHFPPEVIDYLYKSGRQPMSLKNMFYDKWDNLKKED